ncbi:MAG: hypothetical protein M3Z26_16035 [Bacteroidota bacterium]|nr:hypothetical protein [Bacteroidota bacterium]
MPTFKEMFTEPVSRFLGAASVYSSQDQYKQQSTKNIKINTQAVQSANGKVSVIISITGTGKHEINIRTFNSNSSITIKQINLSANETRRIQLELSVADETKPYVAVISLDKNSDLQKEIVGSNSDASILARKK